MREKLSMILVKVINFLSRWNAKLAVSNKLGTIHYDPDSPLLEFYGGNAHHNTDAPRGIVHISKDCEYYGDIIALAVINEGVIKGVIITNSLKNHGLCNAQNSTIRSLEAFSGSTLTGQITVEPKMIVAHKGANIEAVLVPKSGIDLSMYRIIISADDQELKSNGGGDLAKIVDDFNLSVNNDLAENHSQNSAGSGKQHDPLVDEPDGEDDLNSLTDEPVGEDVSASQGDDKNEGVVQRFDKPVALIDDEPHNKGFNTGSVIIKGRQI